MKPSQPHGAVESRVWYAHNLVVSEQHEAKGGESAVAAAARQALESTKSLPRAKVRSRNRAGWFVGVSLAGAAVAAVSLPWRQDVAEPESAIARAPETSSVETAQKVVPAAGNASVEKVAAAKTDETGAVASDVVVQAPAEKLASAGPGTDTEPANTSSITTGTATSAGSAADSGSVSASPFAVSPASSGTGTGELVPSSSAPEIEMVELNEGEPPSADDDQNETAGTAAASNTAVTKTPRVKKRPASQKQSAEYYQTGDCAMPSWAWRVFGFQEPKRKRGCGG